MSETITIGTFTIDEWPAYRDLRLRALEESPDAFSSTFAVEATRPDTEWASRLAAAMDARLQAPFVARLGADPIGLAWVRLETSDPSVAGLYQVWVAPEHRCRGVGRMLVSRAISWARASGAHRLDLDVTCNDTAAMRLYHRLGFTPVGEPHPLRPASPLLSQSMTIALQSARSRRRLLSTRLCHPSGMKSATSLPDRLP